MRRWLVRGLLCVIAALGLACLALVAAGLHDHNAPADLIVVPGNTVAPDGNPSPRLQARLDAALSLYRDEQARRVFVSGGTGPEGWDEAAVMARYLTQHGVPLAAIVQDPQGLDTAATARNVGQFMRQHDLHRALVATQYFHIPRTRLALERQGVQVVGSRYARYVEPRDLYATLREVAAYAVYALRS